MDHNRFIFDTVLYRQCWYREATIGTLMLISRLFDGISDLIMGSIIDRTRTRWGKARPWILWSAIPMGVGLIVMFSIPQCLEQLAETCLCKRYICNYVTVIYTACNLAYNTLLSLATPDTRTVLPHPFLCNDVCSSVHQLQLQHFC